MLFRSKTKSTSAFTKGVYTPEYATGFDIMGADNTESTIIHVRNPWQGAEGVEMSYFVARNGEQAPKDFDGVIIPAGAKRIVCMSSTYIAMLDAINQVDRVVGVSGMNYVSNPYVLAHKETIKDMGAEINYELLVGLAPDLVLLYGIGDAQSTVADKLKELNVPYMYVGEYLEESPLGKAEWLVAISELTDSRETLIVRDKELSKMNDEQLTIFRRRNIGFIFQNYNLVPILNVYENIVLPVELDGDTVDQKFLDEIVHLLGLEDKLKNMPNNLSGGQQQRVAIARALITKPAIVLADEPTGNLDSKTSTEVLGLIKRTSAEFRQTVVMITHNNDIARLADRIVRIEDGKIVE